MQYYKGHRWKGDKVLHIAANKKARLTHWGHLASKY